MTEDSISNRMHAQDSSCRLSHALLDACLSGISSICPCDWLRAVSEVGLYCAGCLVIAGLTTYLFFPETSGIPVEVTHTVFKDHWFWPKAYPEIMQVSWHPTWAWLHVLISWNAPNAPATNCTHQAA